jgi:hypothetical protein
MEAAKSLDFSRLSGSLAAEGNSFVAAIPQAVLANPEGPLGVLGYTNLGWTYAFQDDLGAPDVGRFVEVMRGVCRGSRFGAALVRFQQDLASLSAELLKRMEQADHAEISGPPEKPPEELLKQKRLTRHMLRAFLLLGDPAARLPLTPRSAPQAPPADLEIKKM